MKKILSILLLAALLLSCLPMAGLADRAAAPEDFTFDTVTGKFSFNAVDKNIGFATVRADVPDGAELTVGCNDSPAVVVNKVFC